MYWQHPLHALANAPAVGGPNGAKPMTANDRFMEAFGSVDWPEPLMPTDQQINGPKGKLWGLNDPIARGTIQTQARDAVRADTQAAADTLLQSVRIVSLLNSMFLPRVLVHTDKVRRASLSLSI
jgi:chitinase